MTLIIRLTLLILVAGVAVGIVLRALISVKRFPLLLALSATPWLIHLGYVMSRTQLSLEPLGIKPYIFAGLSIATALGLYLLTLRISAKQRPLAAFFPLALGAVYVLVPVLWFSGVLRRSGVALGSLPTVYLLWSLIFCTVVLLVFGLRLRTPRVKGDVSLLDRLRRLFGRR